MEIANKSLLELVIEELNKYTIKDSKYTTSAIPVTISKFAPSGSLKDRNTNNIFEHKRAVTAKSSKEIFLGLEYIMVIIYEKESCPKATR